jgi:hypothetical protein
MLNETVLKEGLAFYLVVGLRSMFVALSSSRLTRGYLRMCYDNFMFLENKSFIGICMTRDLNKSRISEEYH